MANLIGLTPIVRTASLNALLDKTEFDNPVPMTVGKKGRRTVSHQLEPDVKSHRTVTARANSNDTHINDGRPPASFAALRKLLFSRTIRRLQAKHLSTSRTIEADYAFLLPNELSTPEDLAIFRALYDCPMTVTNADIGKIFNTELSIPTSPPTAVGAHFYMRSWIFTAKELRRVMIALGEYEEVLKWKEVVHLFASRDMGEDSEIGGDLEDTALINADDSATLPAAISGAFEVQTATSGDVAQFKQNRGGEVYFTVRYFGRTTGPRRPVDRYIQDLLRKRYGIFVEFMAVVERLYPKIADAVEVHLLTDASLGMGDHAAPVALALNRFTQDDRECFLIEYFDHSTLLNRQYGGVASQYIARAEDLQIFLALNVKFYHRLSRHANVTPAHMFSRITQHFKMMQEWANVNSSSTGTARHQYTNALTQVTAEQAQPSVYRSLFTIVAVVGQVITLDNYLLARPFFGGESRAAELTASNIHRLAEAEDSNYNASTFNPLLFPFVDLCNWLRYNEIDWACELLRQYFEISQPLIMVSLGRKVNELTRGSFIHRLGVLSMSFIECVGEPTVQFYNKTAGQEAGMAFINVPHYHPGADKYTAHQVELRRVLDLTWQVTFFTGDALLDLIDSYGNDQPSRMDLCQETVTHVKTNKKYAAFWKNFNGAKVDLHSVLGFAGANDDVRPVLNKEGRLRMAALGQAGYKPNSAARRAQLELWWKKDIPDLHLFVPHTADNKEVWIEEFLPLSEGQFFFMQVLNKLPPDRYTDHLLRAIQPAWAKDTSWMNETEKREAAILRCGIWFHRKKKDNEKIKKWYPDVYVSAYDMQGRLVGVGTTGGIRLHWRKDDGTKYLVQIRVKLAIPTPGQAHVSRSIHFTRHGIDIRAADGSSFRIHTATTNSTAKASIPHNLLAGTEGAFNTTAGGQVTLDLWTAVRLAHGKFIPDTDGLPDAKVWTSAKGVAGIARNATAEQPVQNRPPIEGDAIYPLSVWLDQRFPNGGTLRTISASKLLNSTEDLQDLVAFLQSPGWIRHPHVSDWLLPNLERVTGGGPDIALLEKNIRILRSTVKKNTQARNSLPGRNEQHKETIIEVGPPNSADVNPFPAVKEAPAVKKASSVKRKATNEGGEEDGDDGDDGADAGYDEEVSVNPKAKAKAKAKKAKVSKEVENENEGGPSPLPAEIRRT